MIAALLDVGAEAEGGSSLAGDSASTFGALTTVPLLVLFRLNGEIDTDADAEGCGTGFAFELDLDFD